ncbi:MAG: hypothetical protein AAB116_10070 [Candidatus Poribacteria bacterium]
MVKKHYGIIMIVVLVILVAGIYILKITAGNKPNMSANATVSKLISVDEVAIHPENFKGQIGVSGKVINVDTSNKSFALGCDDACIMVPVRYNGQSPNLGSQVVVYGEIKETEQGKYVLDGQKVEVK